MVRREQQNQSQRLLIVEGGGDHNAELKTACREAFTKLQEAAGVKNRARVRPAGGRKAAYDLFCHELSEAAEGDLVALLVDAEDVVTAKSRWEHVAHRPGDGWKKPDDATEDHLHFMAVTMETWLLAEPSGLKAVFGPAFKPDEIPKWFGFEAVPKSTINATIAKATGGYDKGRHSFRALAKVSTPALEAACPSAKALFDHLRS